MRKILFVFTILCTAACNQDAPKFETVSDKDVAQATATTKGTLDSEGPEIDLMKKLISSVEKGDWESAQACFADSAIIFYNQWAPDTTQKGTPARDVLAFEKSDRPNWDNVSYGEPIFEVVTTTAGEKYGHLWARYTAKNKKTGKLLDVPLFASYLIKDGKLQWEWAIYDSKKLE